MQLVIKYIYFFWLNLFRVPCEYRNQNLAVRVEESSKKPNYLALKLLYQGGQTEIVGVDVAQVGEKSHSLNLHGLETCLNSARVSKPETDDNLWYYCQFSRLVLQTGVT